MQDCSSRSRSASCSRSCSASNGASSRSATAQSDVFGSLVLHTVTGFHGAHVIVGLLFNLAVQIWAWRGTFTAERHLAVSNAGLYWHFVDVVWLFVFATIYLLPR